MTYGADPPRFPTAGKPAATIEAALAGASHGGRVPLSVLGARPDVAQAGGAAFNADVTENALGARDRYPADLAAMASR